MKKEYFKNVDFLRFIMAIFIVLLHICLFCHDYSAFLQKFHYDNMRYCVELFFIISGFMLIYTYKPDTTIVNFFLKKTVRFLPTIAFCVLVCFILSLFKVLHFPFMDNVFTLFFLNGVQIVNVHEGLGRGSVSVSWYVSVLVWVSLLYFYIIKNFGLKVLNIFLWFFIFSGLYCLNYNLNTVICHELIRGLSSMAIGCVLGQLFLVYKDHTNKNKNSKLNPSAKILVTLAEMGLFGYWFYCVLTTKSHTGRADIILLFLLLFILFILKTGYFSKFLNNNFSVFLGRYSYSIFISHSVLIHIFQKFWFTQKNTNSLLVSGGGGLALPCCFVLFLGLLHIT